MKINLIPTKKLAILSAAFCAAMLAFTHNASALTIGDTQELGTVDPAVPFGDASATAYVDHLRQMALNTTDTFMSQTIHRSGNDFGPLPAPVFALKSTGPFSGDTTTIDLGDGTLYTYLFAKYDAGNTFSEVWYVGNLSGLITIPNFNGVYGLSGWILFGPGTPGVPDGGTTVMLLGAALGSLGMARRFLKR
jgi:VPDSG-CTERM motif